MILRGGEGEVDVEEGGKETYGVRCLLTAAAGAEKDLVLRSR